MFLFPGWLSDIFLSAFLRIFGVDMISDFASVCCVLFPLSFARFALQKNKLEVSLPYTLEYVLLKTINGGGWKMIFLFTWMIFRFHPLVFRGARSTPPSYYKWKYTP